LLDGWLNLKLVGHRHVDFAASDMVVAICRTPHGGNDGRRLLLIYVKGSQSMR
jgi:hypothetical protein